MNVLAKIAILTIITMTALNASITRLYVGEFDSQFMAGLDARINLGPVFIGGDIRTLIGRTLINEDEKIVGFLPDRSDYRFFSGLNFGNVEIEYSHTCYHRVISETDVSLYMDNVNPEDTDVISLKIKF